MKASSSCCFVEETKILSNVGVVVTTKLEEAIREFFKAKNGGKRTFFVLFFGNNKYVRSKLLIRGEMRYLAQQLLMGGGEMRIF